MGRIHNDQESEALIPDVAGVTGAFSNEPPEVRIKRWQSIKTICLTNFLSATGFSMVLSTIWPFLKSVGGTQDFLGIVVAAFSIGQLLGGPFWGWAADTYSFTSVLYITTALRAIGNLAYGFCAVFPISQDWFMAATRLIVGFAAGSMAVCTSYTSTASSESERSTAMGLLAASGGLGYIFGPLLGIAFGGLNAPSGGNSTTACRATSNSLDRTLFTNVIDNDTNDSLSRWAKRFGEEWIERHPERLWVGDGEIDSLQWSPWGLTPSSTTLPDASARVLSFDYRTAPAFLATLLCIVNWVALVKYFKEFRQASPKHPSLHSRSRTSSRASLEYGPGGINSDIDEVRHAKATSRFLPRDYFAVGLLLFLYFGNMNVLAIYETLTTPYSMIAFKWTGQQADVYNGAMSGVGGALSVTMFILAKKVAAKVGERGTIIVGFFFLMMAQLALIPLPGPSTPTLEDCYIRYNPQCCKWSDGSCTIHPAYNFSNTAHDIDLANRNLLWKPSKWCDKQPSLPLWQFILSCVLVNIGFPLVSVMIFTLFSKVLGPYPQGIWMGYLNAFGSVARTLGPMVTATFFKNDGPRILFLLCSGISLLMALGPVLGFKRLIPHSEWIVAKPSFC